MRNGLERFWSIVPCSVSEQGVNHSVYTAPHYSTILLVLEISSSYTQPLGDAEKKSTTRVDPGLLAIGIDARFNAVIFCREHSCGRPFCGLLRLPAVR